MNSKIRRLSIGMLVCYLALFVQLNILQVGKEQSLAADPRNDRQTIRDFNRPRGNIVTADGVVVARSVPSALGDEYKYQREYPTGALFGGITGYYTFNYGSTQIERTESDVLAGTTAQQRIKAVGDLLGGGDPTGSVVLTMRSDVQQVAKDALGDREGSVVVMDPTTGAVLAMYSYPNYDPNLVAVHDSSQAGDVLAYLNAFPGKPLLNNAYQERYMPGSAFKVITTSIALENGITNLDRQFPVETAWVPPQTTDPIQNYGGEACGGSMIEVFYRSCNIPFAQMAVELGAETMVAGTKQWGVGEKIPIDLPAPAASSFGEVSDFVDRTPLLAIGGFGQASDVMVPLHMAMVASTVANGGTMMKPYVVDATLFHNGTVIDRTDPEVWKTPISGDTAATLNSLMVEVVNKGTARSMQLANGIQAAAKTGTAQLNAAGEPQRSHAWIIGFAPAEAPRYAVAVILKGTTDEISASTGGRVAGPVAKQIFDYLFSTEAAAAASTGGSAAP
ncbi:MAG: penicillin-binding protein [Ilumatobacteraceae bacterium]|nr:penicillin-binding protein [Ilumatobacteraceae bacterium]